MTAVSPTRILAGGLATALLVAACSVPSLDLVLAPGTRQWIINVDNQSNRPAMLLVAEDTSPVGPIVGSAQPASVPPHTTTDVVFTVPAGDSWAIFVNPGPELGPLILAGDVPAGRAGALPLTIMVGADGSPMVSVPDEPGWFGN